jgi:hypothetical protein
MAKKMDKNTLLVAVDFTSFSEEALVFASELGLMGVCFFLLFVPGPALAETASEAAQIS